MIVTLDNWKSAPHIHDVKPDIGSLWIHQEMLFVVDHLKNDPGHEMVVLKICNEPKTLVPIYKGNINVFNIPGYYCISLTDTITNMTDFTNPLEEILGWKEYPHTDNTNYIIKVGDYIRWDSGYPPELH